MIQRYCPRPRQYPATELLHPVALRHPELIKLEDLRMRKFVADVYYRQFRIDRFHKVSRSSDGTLRAFGTIGGRYDQFHYALQ